MAIVDGDGNKIANVIEATIRFSAGQLATVDLTIVGPGVNVKSDIDDVTVAMPCCDTVVAHNCREKRFKTGD